MLDDIRLCNILDKAPKHPETMWVSLFFICICFAVLHRFDYYNYYGRLESYSMEQWYNGTMEQSKLRHVATNKANAPPHTPKLKTSRKRRLDWSIGS